MENMNVCVLGWYGTETLGDRAILEGIIKIFEQVETKNTIHVGSLYPFFTERTLLEEKNALIYLNIKSSISCFDVTNGCELRKHVEQADIVIMGGGPLMDLSELDIVDKAFEYAKKKNKKTGIIGCGIGPLKIKEFRKSTYNILKNSNVSIFRDKNSFEEAKKLNSEFGGKINEYTLFHSNDPAIIPLAFFERKNLKSKDRLVVNFRHLGFQANDDAQEKIKKKLVNMLKETSKLFDEVLLLPNHIFDIGGDDRLYFSELKLELLDCSNIIIEHEPKSLFETFRLIAESRAAIGMRYHSIVFQTFLNGNNYILDYTDFKNGKIKCFLSDLDKNGFYDNRYYSLSDTMQEINFEIRDDSFECDPKIFKETIDYYAQQIIKVLE
jgi:polysaccharide pyruvyl transferase WcaK-like protein